MGIMIRIPFPLSNSKLQVPIVFSLILLLCFISGIRSDSVIQLPTDVEDSDPCMRSGRSPASCPVKCFRPDPVCGADGVTYWCGCEDARCAGMKVVKKGFCEVKNNGAAAQALLLLHIVWLIVLGFTVLFGVF